MHIESANQCHWQCHISDQGEVAQREPINEQADDMADEGRQEEDDVSTWITRTGRMVFKKAGEHGGRKSVWTKGVRDMVRSQASEAVLNKAWNSVAGRWVEYVWWRRGQH